MTPTEVFSIANMIAMPMWVLMLFLSKWKITRFLIDFKVIPLTLAFMYAIYICLLYTSPSPRDIGPSRMPSSA